MKIFTRLAALTLLSFAAHGAKADPCPASTSCSYGTASCSTNCGASSICLSSCICNASQVSCFCFCLAVSLDPGFEEFDDPLTPLLPRTTNGVSVQWSDAIKLEVFALKLHDVFGWGVTIVGDEESLVPAGSYSGTLEEIVDDVGTDAGFTASWNSSTGILTLTVD